MITKIVLSGGPAGGKTSSISGIKKILENKGFNVIVCEESAMSMIKSGINPNNFNIDDYERLLINRQLSSEEMCINAAELMKGDTIILFDRGLLDIIPYTDKYLHFFASFGLTMNMVINRYDAVLHFDTSASFHTGAGWQIKRIYTETSRVMDKKTESHDTIVYESRWITKEEAVIKDRKHLEANKKHPAIYRIRCSENKEEKIFTASDLIMKIARKRERK